MKESLFPRVLSMSVRNSILPLLAWARPMGIACPLGFSVFVLCPLLASAPLLTGCAKGPSYTNIELSALEQGRPFTAEVEYIEVSGHSEPPMGRVVIIALRTRDGDRVAIGGSNATPELAAFARTLKRGATYEFPKVWIEFKGRTKQP